MQPFFVSGSSMEPNFHDGDYLIVDELSYEVGEPKRGDVIIFKYPKNPNEYFIKRIIGLPGEKIEISNNTIRIFNNARPEGFVVAEDKYIPQTTVTTGNYIAELKNDEYYVLGDNRIASADSRWWGVLDRHFIVGKALIRAWPYNDLAIFEGVQY
jgi:signal peptidase I